MVYWCKRSAFIFEIRSTFLGDKNLFIDEYYLAAGELAFERRKRSTSGYIIVRKGSDDLALYGRINFERGFFLFFIFVRWKRKRSAWCQWLRIRSLIDEANFRDLIAFLTRDESKQSIYRLAFARSSKATTSRKYIILCIIALQYNYSCLVYCCIYVPMVASLNFYAIVSRRA